MSALLIPNLDPTSILEHLRGNYATELLTAAVVHFKLFARLGNRSLTLQELGGELGLAERPTIVLVTGLRAMGLLDADAGGRLMASALAREQLQPDSPFDISGYVSLAAENPGVLNMVERLRSNRPAGTEPEGAGAVLVFRQGLKSAMDHEASARHLTMTLGGPP